MNRHFILLVLVAGMTACNKFQRLVHREGSPRVEKSTEKLPTIGTFDFVAVPAGVYRVGSVEGGPGGPPRDVHTAGFWMSSTEVTEKQFGRGHSDRPVADITLGDAQDFCRKLSAAGNRRVRLPTPDEWEIAARGGLRGARYPWGWGEPSGRAVFAGKKSKRVGTFPSNGYGIYDLAGNVAEWCETTNDVVCGGSWADRDPGQLQVFSRNALGPNYKGSDVGFRIVVDKIQ